MEVRLNRIAGNALMIWGRNLVAMVLGVFSSRWVLMSLGADALGLYGALIGLLTFAGLVGGVLQLSMVRSMSVSVGAEGEPGLVGISKASLVLSSIVALVLVVVVLPVGEMYVRCYMKMVPEFRESAIWTWRLVMLGLVISTIIMPSNGILTARQMFGVLSGIGLVQSVAYFALAATMVFVLGALPTDRKLLVYGAGNTAIVIAAGGATVFAARGHGRAVWHQGVKAGEVWRAALGLVRFAACELWSGLGDAVRKNGVTLYLNNVFGGAVTAAWGIGHSVDNHATSLSSAVVNAFMPAAMKGGGVGARLAMESARWGFLTTAVFAVPFCFMSEWVLRLWLGSPPEGAAFFASALMAAAMVHRLGNAQHLIVMERGRVALYHAVVGTTSMLALPLAVVLCRMYGFAGAGWAFIADFAALTVERVVLGRVIAGVEVMAWLRAVLLPCAAATVALASVCWAARCALACLVFSGM